MEPPILAFETVVATTWPAPPVVPVAPAGDAAVVDEPDVPEAFGVDDPHAAAMRPTTVTAARAVTGRAVRRRGAGRGCDGVVASLIMVVPP